MQVVERLAPQPPPETVLTVVRRVFHGSEVHHVLRGASGLELEASTPSNATVELGTRVVVRARASSVPVYPIDT